jgi:hypothetical protein
LILQEETHTTLQSVNIKFLKSVTKQARSGKSQTQDIKEDLKNKNATHKMLKWKIQ